MLNQGDDLVLVEVLQPVLIETGIGLKLSLIHAMADDTVITDIIRKMTDPRRAKIQDRRAGRKTISVELGQTRAESLIQMMNKSWLAVEDTVIFTVKLEALTVR